MEFKHIEYFVETCRHRSLSKAAEALYISQQALSRSIANLEDELGCTLFQRTAKGITLTEDGTYLHRVFAPQVEQFRAARTEAGAHFAQRPVRLPFCCAPLISAAWIPISCSPFRRNTPTSPWSSWNCLTQSATPMWRPTPPTSAC